MERSMRLLTATLLLSFLPITAMAETQVESFTCEPWSNAGIRMRGDVTLELSGLNLMWTNGELSQTAVMVNPEDKLEGNVSEAKRIYVAEDSTAVYFLKRLPTYLSINRTVVAVRETKQNTTYCHPIK